MPSVSREESRDRDSLVLKHQHSFSDVSGRTSVPMWDSSDPDRAPPPLPLNPGGPSSPVTRPNTSTRIEEAAALITAKAREHAQIYQRKNSSDAVPGTSPEKSLIKGHHHKRMQSMQNGSVRDLSNTLERRSPEKGLGRDAARDTPLRTSKVSEYSPERSPTRDTREDTPTPSGRETPTRAYLSKPILSENTPPSATMLALQSMRSQSERDVPLANISNGNTGLARQPQPQSFDALSSQILNITSIATNLQREMTQLSRRSKDNATDLISLKEATNSRDEDIRKSLKELVSNISTKILDPAELSRSTPNLGSYLIDNRAHNTLNTTPGRNKGFSLPRIPSPNSFAASIDRDLAASPSVVSSDGAASIALLEKVLREMGTKDGQDMILKALDDVANKASKKDQSSWDPSLSWKLEEILKFMKDNANSQALVRSTGDGFGTRATPQADLGYDSPRSGPVSRFGREMTPQADDRGELGAIVTQNSEIVNEEIMKILKRVKASIAEGGGLTNEVKALVRELRGEVLGMGREIARKLEQAESSKSTTSRHDSHGPGREEIAQIVEDGLAELREHMGRLIHENRRQSSGSVRSAVDPQEMYVAVRKAIAEQMPQQDLNQHAKLEKEEILMAVREAWEDCKPEIELQNFGLEREEILDCLKQGLKSYQQESSIREVGASYDEVLDAVQKGLRDFRPPPIETEASITREEILMTVRECLESFDFPAAHPPPQSTRELDLTRDDVLDAVKQGLMTQAPITKEIEFNRNDLFDAVRAGLEGAPTPMGGVGEQVLEQMHDLISSMKTEFKQYSAANGKDTEQVLDAMKDGLEELRADIESYVDRAADVTGKDEIIDTVKDGFRALQADFEKGISGRSQARSVDTPELLDAMEKEFGYLRETLTKNLMIHAGGSSSNDKEEILDAIRDMSEVDRGNNSSLTVDNSDIARMVKEELEHMRETLATMLVRSGASVDRDEIMDAVREGMDAHRISRKVGDGSESILSNTSELLDAFQDGVEGIRADMQKLVNRPADITSGLEVLDELRDGLANLRVDIEKMHDSHQQVVGVSGTAKAQEVTLPDGNLISTEIEGLKIMITQLRIKVEALDNMPPMQPAEGNLNKDDIEEIAATLREVHSGVKDMGGRERSVDDNFATKDDTDAIETLLRNAKSQLDDFNPEDVVRVEHVEALDDVLRDIKETVDAHRESAFSKDDFEFVESLLNDVKSGMDDLQRKVLDLESDPGKVTKSDIQAVETLCLDTRTQIEELRLPDPEILPTKADVEELQASLKGLQEQIDADNELTAQAFDARKTEHGGIAARVDDAKVLLGEVRDELMKKLDGSEEGIVELAKTLEMHHEVVGTLGTAATMTELMEMVKENFDRSHDDHDTTKLEVEERDAALMVKHEETKAALTKEIGNRIGDKFNELMTKYDDAQVAAEASRGEQFEAMTSTKAVVDDLKTLIDTLGSTITETCDRMSDDAKTVFIRVDETHNKVDEMKSRALMEHGLTREEIAKTLGAAERLDGRLNEHHPAVLAAIKDIAAIVERHYEHSQKASEEMKIEIGAIPSAIPPLLPALPQPPSSPIVEIPAQKEYDDSQVHDKLDSLIGHAAEAKESLYNMEKLDTIHQQVIATAGEISTLVATQSRLMAEHHESKAQEAQEAAIALEKRTAQKELVEVDIVRLTDEKDELARSVDALRREQAELTGETKRLAREVGVLETALHLRQEEMKVMETRAEGLEKKILEGVMDHARTLMMSRPSTVNGSSNGVGRGSNKRKGSSAATSRDAAMSLKRVPSSTSTVTSTKTSVRDGEMSTTPSSLSSAVGLALKRRAPLREGAGNPSMSSSASNSAKERRILSTSFVQGTPRPSLVHSDYRALTLAPAMVNTTSSPNAGGLVNLKRSHSVKSNPSTYYGGRKASWAGRTSSGMDKENEIHEEDEDEVGSGSDAGTERRPSFDGTESDLYTVTGSSMMYGSSFSGTTGTMSNASSTKGELAGEGGEGGTYLGADDEVESHSELEEETTTDVTESEIRDPLEDTAVLDFGHDGRDQNQDHGHGQDSTTSPEQDDEEGKIMALLDPSSHIQHNLEKHQQQHPEETQEQQQQEQEQTIAIHSQDQAEEGEEEEQYDSVPEMHALDLPAPPKMTGLVMYNHSSDSGIGSEVPTAALEHPGHGEAAEYFDQRNQYGD